MEKIKVRTLYTRDKVNSGLDAAWEYPLTVVEAPMGYGKTTAVKEYLRQKKVKTLWLTLLYDSENSFWHDFCRLFRQCAPEVALRLNELGAPGNSVFWQEALRCLEEHDFKEQTVIVLDDYHLLSSSETDLFLERLVRAEIPNLRLMILSRSLFGENLDELILKGYCCLLGKNQFILSEAEINEYAKVCGVRLESEESGFLHSYTEGWISAVYLCLLGFMQSGKIDHTATLHQLMEQVVYRPLSKIKQELLLEICNFDSFSLEQAETVWNGGEADALLRGLVEDNAFVGYDYESGNYTLHNVFSSYLRRLFERRTLEEKVANWRAIGAWHVRSKEYIKSLEWFYKAGDFASLLQAIELDGGKGIWPEHQAALHDYFMQCPEEIKREHLSACLIYAINLFSFNQMEQFAQQCAELAEYANLLPEAQREEKEQLLGEIELLCSFTEYNRITDMSPHIERAEALLHQPPVCIDRNSSWTFGSPSVLYMFYRESGALAQTTAELETAMLRYERITGGHGSGATLVMQGERHYHRGEFADAGIFAHKAQYLAQSKGQKAIVLCAGFLLLRLALLQGDEEALQDVLRQMRKELEEAGGHRYLHTWELCESFMYCHLEQAKKIPAWIVNGDLEERSLYFPSHAFFYSTWSRVLLSCGQDLKLLGLTDGLIESAAVFPNLLAQLYILIHAAAANERLGRREEAAAMLEKALAIALPDGILMPFVENAVHLEKLLMQKSRDEKYEVALEQIKALAKSSEAQRQKLQEKRGDSKKVLPLTQREMEIAELIASGLSNQAIAKTLHIAEVTVKKALQNIYAKLAIGGRTALVKIIVELASA